MQQETKSCLLSMYVSTMFQMQIQTAGIFLATIITAVISLIYYVFLNVFVFLFTLLSDNLANYQKVGNISFTSPGKANVSQWNGNTDVMTSTLGVPHDFHV